MKLTYRYALLFTCVTSIFSCTKQDKWLDIKRTKSNVTPKSLSDYQGLLENTEIMNQTPALGFMSSDNYYLSLSVWQSLGWNTERNAYTWAKDIFTSDPSFDWNIAYTCIVYANIVLEGVQKITRAEANSVEFDNIQGSAYFFRAFALFNLSQVFSKPYDMTLADNTLGMPIRLTSDVNVKSVRSTLKQTFDQIQEDLNRAEGLLTNLPISKNRPSKVAVYALLAKVHMHLGNYDKVKNYCNKVLEQTNILIDFNALSSLPYSFPFPEFRNINSETIFYAYTGSYGVAGSLWFDSQVSVDTNLYKSYADSDLRKNIFYTNAFGGLNFQGSYVGNTYLFSGLAINEVYLLRAEANARLGNTSDALADLNTLLRTRWKTNEFTDYTAATSQEALLLIIEERNKELPFTGTIRWEDLRRFNKEGLWNKTLIRKLSDQTYSLPPNDNRYVLPIPPDEIRMSGIEQNPR